MTRSHIFRTELVSVVAGFSPYIYTSRHFMRLARPKLYVCIGDHSARRHYHILEPNTNGLVITVMKIQVSAGEIYVPVVCFFGIVISA